MVCHKPIATSPKFYDVDSLAYWPQTSFRSEHRPALSDLRFALVSEWREEPMERVHSIQICVGPASMQIDVDEP